MASTGFRRSVRQVHLWLGITLGALWALQGLSGALLVFHRELERGFGVQGSAGALAPLDRLVAAAPGVTIKRLSVRDRAGDVLLLDGERAGKRVRLLIAAASGRPLGPAREGGWRLVYQFHEMLLLGDGGKLLTGASGLVLASSAIFGLLLAWPRRGGWRAAFAAGRWRTAPQRWHGLHRAIGLIAGFGLVLSAPAGAWLALGKQLRPAVVSLGMIEAPPPAPARGDDRPPITPGQVWGIGQREFPGARLVRLTFPSARSWAYQLRLDQPGEPRGWSGTTLVVVGAGDGRLLYRYDALHAGIGNRIADAAYALHSGELAGLGGRLAVLTLGLALPFFYLSGLALWWRRRPRVREGLLQPAE